MDKNEFGFFSTINAIDTEDAVNTPAHQLLTADWYKDRTWDLERCIDFRTPEQWPDCGTAQHKNMMHSLPCGVLSSEQLKKISVAIGNDNPYPRLFVFTNWNCEREELMWYWVAYGEDIIRVVGLMERCKNNDMSAIEELADVRIHEDLTPKMQSGNWHYSLVHKRYVFRWEVLQLWGANVFTPPSSLFGKQRKLPF